MRQNVGSFDRMLRILLAVILVGVLLQQQRTGTALYLWLGVAAVLLGTGTFGYCPLYGLLGVSTRRALPS
ncbi:YgaP family membrane protein [Hymenobacter convexus]|uniref:YgaP family membrane protein n=1 Tax=Hymenobacter sp. CA1UV-4 TaxID=3063782 RepID=UPI002713974C|nr:DUF2892 domain-containing protein [Hymenobacter sp. CA1UV-4]MDO7852523.1 DUF2892 domain-containing protein [Hymenobacter sp. CA1UV-4]